MNLVIVESPTKARTLTRFLKDKYTVMASMGHIRDLPKSQLGVDVKHDFKPDYQIPEGKEAVAKQLTAASQKAQTVFLATDPDREGEAIAYHVMKLVGNGTKFSRITFHEITKQAILDSLEHPGSLNLQLVHAQQARRILDRLVGYNLSPLLWRKVRKGLSAGRVQSVTVRLILDRENEIEGFKPQEYWEIGALVNKKGDSKTKFQVDLYKIGDKKAEVKDGKTAKKIVADLKRAGYLVKSIDKRQTKQSPPPPYITSTLQRAAANLFGWSSKKTMREAQRLYENGYITYHRTDSVNLAASALAQARTYIKAKFGKEFLPDKSRVFKTRSKLAQEAHEAIRPTSLKRDEAKLQKRAGAAGYKLYQLVFKRFVASQMAARLVDKTTVEVAADKYLLQAKGEVEQFAGWKKLYGKTHKEEEALQLPELEEKEKLQLIKVLSEQKFTQPPPRYTESSLIKTLEKLGIGRPSTYAPTISTILYRKYVEKIEGSFYPTRLGKAVTIFLQKYFPKVMDYEFTAGMEDELDKIAQGNRKWVPVLRDFFQPFAKQVDEVKEKAKRVKIEVEKTGRVCPECKKGEVVIRLGRFGRFLSCSRFPDCKYTENYVQKVGKKCPECKKGDVVVRRSKKGRRFFGCSRYPECKWASWKQPK
jgi:DNA topoisomerase-1